MGLNLNMKAGMFSGFFGGILKIFIDSIFLFNAANKRQVQLLTNGKEGFSQN